MKQLGFDWTWAQRREWINEAVLTSGRANDGRPVSASAMAGVLNAINDHLGDNVEAWPSQATIAQRLKVSEKTVQRASQALESLSLLIVTARPSKSGTCNYYRIVWSELQLLSPERRAAWAAILGRKSNDESPAKKPAKTPPTGPSDTTPQPSDNSRGPSDTLTGPSDTLTGPSDTMSDEHYKEDQKEDHHHYCAEPAREPDHEPERSAEPHTVTQTMETSQTWGVVVSELERMGMSQARTAVDAARRRGMSLEQVRDLMELYRERAKRTNASTGGRRITVGWLYRWIAGLSQPEPEPEPANVESSQRGDALKPNQIADEALRVRIVRAGRAAGATPEQIEQRLTAAGV